MREGWPALPADSRVAAAAGVESGQAVPAHYRYCCNKPSNNSDKYEREAGVTNVSLSYDYLAGLLPARIVRCGLQNGLSFSASLCGAGWLAFVARHPTASRFLPSSFHFSFLRF